MERGGKAGVFAANYQHSRDAARDGIHQAGVHDQRPRSAVVEHEAKLRLPRSGIDRHRNSAHLHRTDEHGHELRAVRQQDGHPLLWRDTGRSQRVARTVDQRLQVRIADRRCVRSQCRSAAASLLDVPIHQRHGHVEHPAWCAAGQLEHGSRLQCAGFRHDPIAR